MKNIEIVINYHRLLEAFPSENIVWKNDFYFCVTVDSVEHVPNFVRAFIRRDSYTIPSGVVTYIRSVGK